MSQESTPLDLTARPLRILVPLDRSPLADVALDYLAHLPLSGGEITLLHVLPDPDPFIPELADGSLQEGITAEIEQRAMSLRSEDRTVNVQVATGDPGEAIIDASEGYDLVVMTTHGRGAAGRVIFGSVTDRITRHGTVPTLVLRAGEHGAHVPPPRRILRPLDGSPLAERAIPVAARLAAAMSLRVGLVRAIDLDAVRAAIHDARTHQPVSSEASVSFDQARRTAQDAAAGYLETVRQRFAGAGLKVTGMVLEGTVTFALLGEIQPTDLVVMTSHGRGGFRRWLLGSVAEKLIRESAGPILLIPTRDT
jgi:nucleotide-binding universal stress UspA family protein